MSRWNVLRVRNLFPFPRRINYKLLIVSCLLLTVFFFLGTRPTSRSDTYSRPIRTLAQVHNHDEYLKSSCRFYTCFNIHSCPFGVEERIGVYIHPHYEYENSISLLKFTPTISEEYSNLLEAVRNSPFYQPDITKACVIIPSIDTLNQNSMDVNLTTTLLNSLPSWNEGQNHLIFNMLPGTSPHFYSTPDFYYGKAMIAGGGFSRATYRERFDISIPVFNSFTRSNAAAAHHHSRPRTHLLTVLSHGLYSEELTDMLHLLEEENKGDVLLLENFCPSNLVPHDQLPWKRCNRGSGKVYTLLEILHSSVFCLLLPGQRHGSPDLTDILMMGCIPMFLDDDYVVPFSEVLDWSQASVTCWSSYLVGVASQLRDIPKSVIREKQNTVNFIFKHYFSSMASIALTTLGILNKRVFPMSIRDHELWPRTQVASKYLAPGSELDLLTPAVDQGFTAVILTYNRVSELFKAIQSVACAPSLAKIIVVWNNVDSLPPPAEEWPHIKRPIQVIRSKANLLSNRFYPYPEIQTSAVFSLDDDITMLTADELEFGYKAWLEFPNRIVGFPGRVHVRDNSQDGRKRWKYESNWLNNISLVLTGASFYHNYYNYLYTFVMPVRIREWVDKHMNCEDIAMNFLVADHTRLPPLKVSPRKKFTCPTCTSENSLWNDPEHYQERDECINIFEEFFGGMPLQTVNFRLDPVLYKDKAEEHINAYPDFGEL